MAHGYLVRVMTNDRHGTLHRLLVFLEGTGGVVAAIAREKQITGGQGVGMRRQPCFTTPSAAKPAMRSAE